jgi:hypothetical protein
MSTPFSADSVYAMPPLPAQVETLNVPPGAMR